ncbi:MAG: Unknown protein [uncultured Sulfurovum sp.]|uniref:Uncharacterized protein n=1 Tax=uncultured Sulfurovum sp. TaxID=269237 RepID=A0A6S6ST92_9BACT|nr:MAG: Unknown protein [uncultured Sulfurovum sp.]
MNYLPIEMPVLEKLMTIAYEKKKRIYKDNETGIMYYWFRNNGKGSRKGYYVDLDTVSDKEAFIKMSKNFEDERERIKKEEAEKEAHWEWAKANYHGIKAIHSEIKYYSDAQTLTKDWNDNQKVEAEGHQAEYYLEEKRNQKLIAERLNKLPQPLREFADKDGYFPGFEISDFSQHGTGRGYSGYFESINSQVAKKEGKFSKTAAAKILRIKPVEVEVNLFACEYHHTSKKYNSTDFYDIRPYYYLMHGQVDNLHKYLEEIDCVDMDDEDGINGYINNYKKTYNTMVSEKRRIK